MGLFGKGGSKPGEDPLALMQAGDYKRAIKVLQARLRQEPHDRTSQRRLAEAFEGAGQKEDAANLYRTEGEALIAGGDRAQGLGFLKKALKLLPSDTSLKEKIAALEGVPSAEGSFSFDLDASEEAPAESSAAVEPESTPPEEAVLAMTTPAVSAVEMEAVYDSAELEIPAPPAVIAPEPPPAAPPAPPPVAEKVVAPPSVPAPAPQAEPSPAPAPPSAVSPPEPPPRPLPVPEPELLPEPLPLPEAELVPEPLPLPEPELLPEPLPVPLEEIEPETVPLPEPAPPMTRAAESDEVGLMLGAFPGLDAVEVMELIACFGCMTLQPGEVLIREGEAGEAVYLVIRGKLSARARLAEEEVELATLTRGDVLGEVSFLHNVPRTATVTALESTVVLEMPGASAKEQLATMPHIKDRLEALIEERVNRTLALVKQRLREHPGA